MRSGGTAQLIICRVDCTCRHGHGGLHVARVAGALGLGRGGAREQLLRGPQAHGGRAHQAGRLRALPLLPAVPQRPLLLLRAADARGGARRRSRGAAARAPDAHVQAPARRHDAERVRERQGPGQERGRVRRRPHQARARVQPQEAGDAAHGLLAHGAAHVLEAARGQGRRVPQVGARLPPRAAPHLGAELQVLHGLQEGVQLLHPPAPLPQVRHVHVRRVLGVRAEAAYAGLLRRGAHLPGLLAHQDPEVVLEARHARVGVRHPGRQSRAGGRCGRLGGRKRVRECGAGEKGQPDAEICAGARGAVLRRGALSQPHQERDPPALVEQRTVQMVRILNKSTSINELHSMVPMLGSLDTMQFPDDDVSEKDRVKESLSHYRGVHVSFPLRLDTVKKLINQFRNGILLHRVFVRQILDESEKLFRKMHESPMNDIKIPMGVQLVVVGDLHGQLEDLLTIMDKNGVPSSKTWYLFNGDFVDRGSHGIEVILLLLIFKLLYPDFVFLNRGNHEERMINEVFGFEDEVYTKYGTDNDEVAGWSGLGTSINYSPMKLFQMFETVFGLFPIFSLLNKRVFIVHGGLSNHENVTIEELLQLDHRREIPTQGTSRADEVFTHLLWSDPRDEDGWKPSSRGAGVEFGPDITKAFCAQNGISLIIRSHECREEGFDIVHDGLLLTVFSASSYCGSQTNKGAYVQLELGEDNEVKPHVVQFSSQPLQKLKDAGRNEWRKKAQRLERRTLMSLVEIICEKKNVLLSAFNELDTTGSGRVTKLEWKATLQKVLGIQASFLSYFHQLAEEDQQGGVDYQKFLNRYTVELDGGNVEWRRNLIRKVWMGFCQALPRPSETDSEKMTLQDKLHFAFNLFQSPPPGAAKKELVTKPTPKSGENTQVNSTSSNGDKSQPKENYLRNGLVTAADFRADAAPGPEPRRCGGLSGVLLVLRRVQPRRLPAGAVRGGRHEGHLAPEPLRHITAEPQQVHVVAGCVRRV
ncbi:hypothetical protein ON010_g7889 [Phytophthora cinnamomi]|nr:hypothetical protein ON010_g7889 [Phytophthora cinnamomi]